MGGIGFDLMIEFDATVLSSYLDFVFLAGTAPLVITTEINVVNESMSSVVNAL